MYKRRKSLVAALAIWNSRKSRIWASLTLARIVLEYPRFGRDVVVNDHEVRYVDEMLSPLLKHPRTLRLGSYGGHH